MLVRWKVTVGLVFCFALCGCFSPQPSNSNSKPCQSEVLVLLIDEDVFPEPWVTESTTRPVDHHYAIRRCGRGFLVTNGVAFQDVYEYAGLNKAHEEYERQSEIFFSSNDYTTPWKPPSFASKISLRADEFHLACAEYGGTPMCGLLARYDVVIVLFHTHMSPYFMDGEDLVKIVDAIDAKLTQNRLPLEEH